MEECVSLCLGQVRWEAEEDFEDYSLYGFNWKPGHDDACKCLRKIFKLIQQSFALSLKLKAMRYGPCDIL